MADLTPEERQKIYLEEKARLEARRQLEGNKTSAGKVIGYIVLGVLGLLVILFVIGSAMQQSEDAAFKKLTPEQRHAQTLQNCAKLLKSFEYNTYSELSVTEREAKAACTEQLLHPDQDIIKPSP
jgi:cytoskeletal protein RodZ